MKSLEEEDTKPSHMLMGILYLRLGFQKKTQHVQKLPVIGVYRPSYRTFATVF